ncbi:MAG: extracellular solute-binding protein [Candidatus Sumerlaeia bacterium]|nr:extracellular solute-binding protein [Candidatus Sumerlaeia bacterium]
MRLERLRKILGATMILVIVVLIYPSCIAPRAPHGKILVEFWDYPRHPAVLEYIQQRLVLFQEENPDIHVEYTRLSWGKGGERLDIAAFAGRPPDLAGATLNLKYVEAGLLQPLDEYIDEPIPGMEGMSWRDDIHPEILADMQWDGQTWGMPWFKEGFVLLLNNDILRERGVSPPDGGMWSWDEFLETMRRVTFDRNGDGRIDVHGVGFSTGKEKWEAYPFLFGEGMRILNEDGRRMVIDSKATRRGIQRLLSLEFEERVALPGAGGIQDDTTWTAFSGPERRLAATAQGLWSINSVEVLNQLLEDQRIANPTATDLPPPLDISVAHFPRMPGKPQEMASYGVGCYMVFKRPTAPERTEAAARLARFLTLEDEGQKINRAAGVFPSRISHAKLLADDPRYEPLIPYIAGAHSPPVHPAWLQIDQVIGEQLQLVLLRRIDVDTAVSNMQTRGQMVLDAYWQSRDAAER